MRRKIRLLIWIIVRLLSGVKTLKVKLASLFVVEWKQCYLGYELKMVPNTCFESLSFVPFSTDESFINNENDPDVNFYNDVFTLDTQYLAPDKFQRNFKPFSKKLLSILHQNIRSINKNFEAFKQFYLSLNFNFSIVCFSET